MVMLSTLHQQRARNLDLFDVNMACHPLTLRHQSNLRIAQRLARRSVMQMKTVEIPQQSPAEMGFNSKISKNPNFKLYQCQ